MTIPQLDVQDAQIVLARAQGHVGQTVTLKLHNGDLTGKLTSTSHRVLGLTDADAVAWTVPLNSVLAIGAKD